MKKKRKWLISAAVVLTAVIGFFVVQNVNAVSSDKTVVYTELRPGDLVNSIGTKGTVESVSKNNVYSTLNLTVKTINAEVGDRVEAGQVLCVLDSGDLELDIAKQKADLNTSQKSSLNQLENNQRIYNEAAAKLTNGNNSQIVSAQSSLKSAEVNLENAKRDYENTLNDLKNNSNTQIINAESSLKTATLDLEAKEKNLENNRVLYEVGAISKSDFDNSNDAYISSLNKYNDALTSLENAKASQERTLTQQESSLKTAQINYDNALASLNSATTNASQDLENYKNNVESSKISASNDSQLITIQKLEKQLADSVIKAPVSGTVTAVYAKEGTTGSGLLFVIEDTDNLKISTRIKEYDVGFVKEGMAVEIKSDSTGDAVYSGVVTSIDPTAAKASNGETDTTSDIEFKASVMVSSRQTALKIGANTRLNIILEKNENVYYVPYDAVGFYGSSESVVYTVEAADNGSFVARQLPVATGMETDFYVEITGPMLADGMLVINDAAEVTDGMRVTVK